MFGQAEKGYGYFKLERIALSMLIAGPVLWLLGSIHNSCQIYERADGHVQILQEAVLIPFLMASLLFLVGAVLNNREHIGYVHHGLELLVSTSMHPIVKILCTTEKKKFLHVWCDFYHIKETCFPSLRKSLP